jgi:hypothetical protein
MSRAKRQSGDYTMLTALYDRFGSEVPVTLNAYGHFHVKGAGGQG